MGLGAIPTFYRRLIEMLKQTLIAGAAISAALAFAVSAQAATTYYSGSTTSVAPNGWTPVIDFTAPSSAKVDVTVTDCCIGGDNYATYVDGNLIGTTPPELAYGSVLSTETFVTTLGLGTSHNFQLQDQWLGDLPAGVSVSIGSAAPEPTSWALMLAGVFGVGAVLRSRKAVVQAA